MLNKGFKIHFPQLKIIGEQEKEYEGVLETNYDQFDFPELPKNVDFPKQYQASRSCLWIDPVDNTRGFIAGEIDAVTTLIGMSYANRAELGVIAIPFKKIDEKIHYNPSILFGSVSGGFAYEYFLNDKKWIEVKNEKPLRQKARIIMSPTRQNIVQRKIAQQLNCETMIAGGSGYKMSMIAKRQAQIMAYALSFTQKWDTCAGQAVIKSVNGFCTTQFGKDIVYDPQNPKQYNADGVICSLSSEIMRKSIQICKNQRINNEVR